MRKADILVLASANRHKYEEFKILFKNYPKIQIAPANEFIRNVDKLGLTETSDHYYDNAIAKARTCNHGCHYPSLADDSGLEVDALEGRPGVRSHRFAIPTKGQTQDQANNLKLLDELKKFPADKRGARFVCHLVLVMEGILVHTVGILDGTIATEIRGADGFGYDPIFIPRGETKTVAELGPDFKARLSHRALAVQNLMLEINKQEIVLAKP